MNKLNIRYKFQFLLYTTLFLSLLAFFTVGTPTAFAISDTPAALFVSISPDTEEASQVISGQTLVPIFKFSLEATGPDVSVDQLKFYTASNDEDYQVKYLHLQDGDTVLTKPTPLELNGTDPAFVEWKFKDPIILHNNEIKDLTIYADFNELKRKVIPHQGFKIYLSDIQASSDGTPIYANFPDNPDIHEITILNGDATNQYSSNDTKLQLHNTLGLEPGDLLISKQDQERMMILSIDKNNFITVLRGAENTPKEELAVYDGKKFKVRNQVGSQQHYLFQTKPKIYLGTNTIYGAKGLPEKQQKIFEFSIEALDNPYDADEQKILLNDLTLTVSGTARADNFEIHNLLTDRLIVQGDGSHDGKNISLINFNLTAGSLAEREIPEGTFQSYYISAHISVDPSKPESITAYLGSLGSDRSTPIIDPSAFTWLDGSTKLPEIIYWVDQDERSLTPPLITFNEQADDSLSDVGLIDSYVGSLTHPAKLASHIVSTTHPDFQKGEPIDITLGNSSSKNYALFRENSCTPFYDIYNNAGHKLDITHVGDECTDAIITKLIPTDRETHIATWDQTTADCHDGTCTHTRVPAGFYKIKINDLEIPIVIKGEIKRAQVNEIVDLEVFDQVEISDYHDLSIKLESIKNNIVLLSYVDNGEKRFVNLAKNRQVGILGIEIQSLALNNNRLRIRIKPRTYVTSNQALQTLEDILVVDNKDTRTEILDYIANMDDQEKTDLVSKLDSQSRRFIKFINILPNIREEGRGDIITAKLQASDILDNAVTQINNLKVDISPSVRGTLIDFIKSNRNFNYRTVDLPALRDIIKKLTILFSIDNMTEHNLQTAIQKASVSADQLRQSALHGKFLDRTIVFSDVDDNYWAYPYVKFLFDNNISSGYSGAREGQFGPNDPITRAEILKIVLGAIGETISEENPARLSFIDVDPAIWYARYIKRARDLGIIEKIGNTFKPNQAVTRAEAMKIILKSLNKIIPRSTFSKFTDVKEKWQINIINFAADLGIINGFSDGTFHPNDNISRAELAKIITLAIQNIGTK